MIKKFDDFINEAIGDVHHLKLSLTDEDTNKIYKVNFIDTYKKLEDDEEEGVIYVMPDDTVECRTLTGKYALTVRNLTGEEVRKNELHKHTWVFRLELPESLKDRDKFKF